MSIYRYSPQSVEGITRKAVRQSQVVTSLALLAGFAVVALTSGFSSSLQVLLMVVVFGALFFWMQHRSNGRIKAMAESTEIEIDDDALQGRNSFGTVTISKEEVTELRYLNDGILVRGPDLRQALQLKPELEQYSDLVERLEAWVPAQVIRKRSSGSLNRWTTAIVLANLALMVTALSAASPGIAVPCCVIEAVFLIGCAVWVWGSEVVPSRLKRMMIVIIFPALSLLGRAYLLWSQV